MRSAMIAAVCTALGWLGIAAAHHSPAVFDRSREVRVEGTVKEFRWGMPHSWIHLDVAGEAGVAGEWTVEMNPASSLVKPGWSFAQRPL